MRFIRLFARWLSRGAIAGLICLATSAVLAVEPTEMLKDPELERRAREISQDIRCVVCRNQSIDDSNAEIARDLRVVLRERLTAGDSNAQAVQYLVDRYGSYILLKPPFQIETYMLWFGPLVLLILAFLGFRNLWRQPVPPSAAENELSDADRALISSILAHKDTQ